MWHRNDVIIEQVLSLPSFCGKTCFVPPRRILRMYQCQSRSYPETVNWHFRDNWGHGGTDIFCEVGWGGGANMTSQWNGHCLWRQNARRRVLSPLDVCCACILSVPQCSPRLVGPFNSELSFWANGITQSDQSWAQDPIGKRHIGWAHLNEFATIIC